LENGRLLSWSYDNTLALWDQHGELISVLDKPIKSVKGVIPLNDGRILSYPWNNSSDLQLWDQDGNPLQTLSGHHDEIRGTMALRDGRLLSWSNDTTLRLWDAQGQYLRTLEGHTYWIVDAIQLHDGRLLSWTPHGEARLWTEDGDFLNKLNAQNAIQLRDGHLLTCAGQFLNIWDVDAQHIRTDHHHTNQVMDVYELRDQRILSWDYDGNLLVWDEAGHFLITMRGHRQAVLGAIQLKDGRIISWGEGTEIYLWKEDGERIDTLHAHVSSVSGVIELDDGRLISCGGSKDFIWKEVRPNRWNVEWELGLDIEADDEQLPPDFPRDPEERLYYVLDYLNKDDMPTPHWKLDNNQLMAIISDGEASLCRFLGDVPLVGVVEHSNRLIILYGEHDLYFLRPNDALNRLLSVESS
jgi:WD40 repeat protein